jgi:hypothetical protein
MSTDPLTVPIHTTPYYCDRPNPRAAYVPVPSPSPHAVDVCPHCKRALNQQPCPEHGKVVPMRSAVVNVYTEPDWSAA